MADSTAPPPPPPPPSRSGNPNALLIVGGVIIVLLIVLIVVLLGGGSSDTPDTSTSAVVSTTSEASVTTSAAAPDTTSDPLPDPGDLWVFRPGYLVISSERGIQVYRPDGGLAGHPIHEPTQTALPTPDGKIVHNGPVRDDYPDSWPPTLPSGDPTVWLMQPDGSAERIYTEGDRIRLVEVAVVPDVSPGPSLIALRSDLTDDFPFRSDSIVFIPLDGSPPHVIPEVSGFESIVTSATWMDGFLAVSLAGEGFESFDTYDLDGNRVPWATNPEPADTRDPEIHVWNLTRVGSTSMVAYTRSPGWQFEQPVELVVYDTATGVEVASVPLLVAGYDVVTLSASNSVIVASVVEDTGVGDWPYEYSTVAVVDTATFIVDGVDVTGSAAVVGG